MKQRIALLLALILSVSMMANLTSCKRTGEEIEPSISESTEPSDTATSATQPTEPSDTVPPTAEPTEPSETTPPASDPAEDYKNDLAYYPFPLLNMTVEEIEQKYGKVIFKDISVGWIVCSIEGYEDFYLLYDIDIDDDYRNETYIEQFITPDLVPERIYVWGNVYPGIKKGMKYGEIDFQNMPNREFRVDPFQDAVTFQAFEFIQVEYCTMSVQIGQNLPWDIVEKYLGYEISADEAWNQRIVIEPEDLTNWLQNGHMDEIADIEISLIEINKLN